jgi:integrase
MNEMPAEPPAAQEGREWQKTQFANLIRYVPSGTYYARIRIRGKLLRKSLGTDLISVAKLRLTDFERAERQAGECKDAVANGKMTFGQAMEVYRERVKGNAGLKPRTKFYHQERLAALLKSWPGLAGTELRRLSKSDCLNWGSAFGSKSSASSFNHTISILRAVLEIGVESGARYDNPARFVKRLSEKPKRLELPAFDKFEAFVGAVETSGSGFSKPCGEMVRFLAFGGFRKTEASQIAWADCDLAKGKIVVRGDPVTGTKNGEVREVPMIPEMRQMLDRMRGERPDESNETPVLRVRECQKAMDRAAKAVGMKRITHHDLRHLFATRCIESGVDIPTVSRWLGHKDGGALAMKVYGHLRDQHSVKMAQKVTFMSEAAGLDSFEKLAPKDFGVLAGSFKEYKS